MTILYNIWRKLISGGSMPSNGGEFEIQPGSAVRADWSPEGENEVKFIDVIVIDPGEDNKQVLVGEHSVTELNEIEIISAVGEILPGAVLGLLERDPYTREEFFTLLANGGNVPISNPVQGTNSAIASSRFVWAEEANRRRKIPKD